MNEHDAQGSANEADAPALTSRLYQQRQQQRLDHLATSERKLVHKNLRAHSCYGPLYTLGTVVQGLGVIVAAMMFIYWFAVVAMLPQSSAGPAFFAFLMGLLSAALSLTLQLAIGAVLKWLADMGDVKLEMLVNTLEQRRQLVGTVPSRPKPTPRPTTTPRAAGETPGSPETDWDENPPLSEPTVCPACVHEIPAGELRCGICGWTRPLTEEPDEPAADTGKE